MCTINAGHRQFQACPNGGSFRAASGQALPTQVHSWASQHYNHKLRVRKDGAELGWGQGMPLANPIASSGRQAREGGAELEGPGNALSRPSHHLSNLQLREAGEGGRSRGRVLPAGPGNALSRHSHHLSNLRLREAFKGGRSGGGGGRVLPAGPGNALSWPSHHLSNRQLREAECIRGRTEQSWFFPVGPRNALSWPSHHQSNRQLREAFEGGRRGQGFASGARERP
jgi:hypothetical protein